ncbi:MAG TPA: hypothetical protein VNB49_08025 [Candidatus Dormibacteraeota bacterium]|nr:hypothetical protein [Candidatus Dormibacteraeota bacterium]
MKSLHVNVFKRVQLFAHTPHPSAPDWAQHALWPSGRKGQSGVKPPHSSRRCRPKARRYT